MLTNLKLLIIPIVFIAFIILSIILLIVRKKIIAKYDVGYISSFLFASYMLVPILALMSTIATPANAAKEEIPIALIIIYPIIGLSIFLFANRNTTLKYKIGKFFAMLAIGICGGYIFIFKILGFAAFSSKTSAKTYQPIPNIQGQGNDFRVRINEYGEIYDYGGNMLGRINENNDIFYPNGNFYAHMDYAGDICDSSGKYLGRIKNGEIQNSNWEYIGRINKD